MVRAADYTPKQERHCSLHATIEWRTGRRIGVSKYLVVSGLIKQINIVVCMCESVMHIQEDD